MKVMVVEDDERMGALLVRGLRGEGHVVDLASDGAEGLDFAIMSSYDVLVLDVMLPGLDGFELARGLRERGCRTPILMLTAKDTKKDIVTGLDCGADDYLTKPFAFEELLARIRALTRRGPIARNVVLRVGDLELDSASHRVVRGGRNIELTPREFQILELLMRRSGNVVSREAMIDGVWGHASEVALNTVDVFMSSLRAKIDREGKPLIGTVRGVGFCLKASST